MFELKKQHQLYRNELHNDIYGDCYRTAFACLLGLDAHKVPHWNQLRLQGRIADADKARDEWLAERGLAVATIFLNSWGEDMQDFQHAVNRHAVYLFSGKSPRGNWSHVTIAKGGSIIWDPAPKGCYGWGTLDGPCVENGCYEIEYLIPLIKSSSASS